MALLFSHRTQTTTRTKMLSTLRLASSNPKALLLRWHLMLKMETMVSHLALPMEVMVTLVAIEAMKAMVVIEAMAIDQRKFALDPYIQRTYT